MKRLLCFVLVLFGCGIFANGQQATPVPQPTPNQMENVRERIRQNQASERRAEVIRNGGNRNINPNLQQIFYQSIEPLYRKPTRTELQIIAPRAEDVRKYAEFLEEDDTGIFRLVTDLGCAENPNIVVATPDCLKYSMPGAGSSFSFRFENYRIRRLADLTFTNGNFQSFAILQHGILVNLGDIPLEQVSLNTRGVKFMMDFVPAVEAEQASEISRKLIAGVENDGFMYRSVLRAQENSVYLLRSIAYRGVYMRAVQNVAYNEMFFDKRRDILIAFRVIRKDPDGSLTILWKELQNKKSPKLEQERPNRNEVRRNSLAEETE